MKHFFLVWFILALNYMTPSFGMILESDHQPMDEGCVRSLQNTSKSAILEELKSSLIVMVEKNDEDGIIEWYKKFDNLQNINWEEEASSLEALPWESGLDYKKRVGAHLFWESVNTPHQNLFRQALSPLKEATADKWQEVYDNCANKVFNIISTHHYMRVPARAYAIAIAAHYGNSISKLISLEFLHFLKPDNKIALKRARALFSFNLRDNEFARRSLKEFLTPDTRAFVDLSEDKLNDESALKIMSSLGLPHYDICLGNYYFRKARPTEKTKDRVAPLLVHYQRAIERGDPSGYLCIMGLKSCISELDIKECYETQRKVFELGYFEKYTSLSQKDRENLKDFINFLYEDIKNLLIKK